MITPAEIAPDRKGYNLRDRVRAASRAASGMPEASHYWVCVDPDAVIQAVLIPLGLSRRHVLIAMAHGERCFSDFHALADRWGLAIVLARGAWGAMHEAFGNPPFPKAIRLVFVS